jgi:hypothetical protein
MPRSPHAVLLVAVLLLAVIGAAAAQTPPTGPAPTPGPGLALPPLGTPGSGTGSGTGGQGNRRLGGSAGGVPGMHRVPGPTSGGILMPGNAPGLSGGVAGH